MTVGVAGLAEQRRAIVIVVDKLFTRGQLDLQAEEDTAKVIPFVAGWLAVYAGDPTFAQGVVARAATIWLAMKPKDRPTFQIGLIKLVRSVYRKELDEAINHNVLGPNHVDPVAWRMRRSQFDEATRRRVEAEIATFRDQDGGCDLLICGFDPRGTGHILYIGETDQQDEPSVSAIGSGADLAFAQLAWRSAPGADDVMSVLYRVFEAKTYAETNAYVGKRNADALLMLPAGVFALDPQAKMTLSKLVAQGRKMRQLPIALKGFSPVAIAPAQPASQSRSAAPQKASRPAPSHPSTRRADRARPQRGSFHRPSQPRRSEKP
jgi:hypothetical protein